MLTDSPDTSTAFARLLTDSQAKLYAFVFAQVPDAHQANDVFQETNRVLWEQAASFDHAREFLPWAFAVARNQIRAARQKARRDRLAFDDDTVARIADRMSTRAQALDERQLALAQCLQRLSAKQRSLLERRYGRDESVHEIATRLEQSANAVAVTLFRLRKTLSACIRGAMSTGATS